mgnify:CR=1 FL=1
MDHRPLIVHFDVPNHPEPIDLVREFAFRLRDEFGAAAGEHYLTPSDEAGCVLVRVALPRRMPAYQRALWALVKVDLWCLRAARLAGQPIRPIYQSVCYQRERAGQEVWRSSKALSLRGIGDCEDLACARVAERLSVGDYCRPAIQVQRKPGGGTLYHVLIQNVNETTEDPSALLGMDFGAKDGPDRTVARCWRSPVPPCE